MIRIEVVGPGCSRCERLAAEAERALKIRGFEGEVVKIREIAEMLKFEGVTALPALVIDGKVRSCGRVVRCAEIARLLDSIGASARGTADPHLR